MNKYTIICKKTWNILGTVEAYNEVTAARMAQVDNPNCDIVAINSSIVTG